MMMSFAESQNTEHRTLCESILSRVVLSSVFYIWLKINNFTVLKMSVTDFASIAWSDTLTLFINGSKISLKNPDPSELLSTYLREDRGLKGTKVACGEGGCGACSIVLKKKNEVIAVNSCMRFLCANDGLAITTVEGIGSVRKSLSSEQVIK